MDLKAFINPVVTIAQKAGDAILEVYADDFEVQSKADKSPVTRADLAADRLINEALGSLTPDIPVLSEESDFPDFTTRQQWTHYWLVDPLDGTREFVNRNGEFTVNIALIEEHRPVLGVVHIPTQNKTYTGCEGSGAYRRDGNSVPVPISVSPTCGAGVRILGSRSHRGCSLDAYLEQLGEHDFRPMGSSIKFCTVAEGGADLYPRFGPTSEWDTAAGQAVVEQAGGRVVKLDGKPLSYNQKDKILNPHFMVMGSTERDWLALLPERG